MARDIGRRLIRSAALLLALILVIFVVTQVVGDPVARSLPPDATADQYERRQASYGLDRPLSEQFREYVTGAVVFDYGDSFIFDAPATEVVLDRLPRTAVLVVASMALAGVLGLGVGIAMAFSRRGSWLDRGGNLGSLFVLSIPQFWLGILFILVFAVWLGWFPTSGTGSLRHLVLPVATLTFASAGRMAQVTQSALRDELVKPYVRTAMAKGLSTRRVLVHALRNAAVTVTTMFGYEFVTVFAGYTILVEVVFAWPGIGLLLRDAVLQLDLPLTAATTAVIATVVVVGNAVVDFAYGVLDPRIAAER